MTNERGIRRTHIAAQGGGTLVLLLALSATPVQARLTSAVGEPSAWDFQPGQGPYHRQEVQAEKQQAAAAQAASAPAPQIPHGSLQTRSGWEAGLAVARQTFNEDQTPAIKERGISFGVRAAYTKAWDKAWVARFEGAFDDGPISYKDSTTSKDMPRLAAEARVLLGRDIVRSGWAVWPYVGLGYRFAEDSSYRFGNVATDQYTRQVHYLYVPIGVQPRFALRSGDRIKLTAEYDPLLRAWQDNRLSEAAGGWPDLSTTIKSGYGLRGQALYETGSWGVGPYATYWNISHSEPTCGVKHDSSGTALCGDNAHNDTQTYGLSFVYHFAQE